ncbi:MAG: TlpA disulfide reductase family protein [Gelidibacter sp.]
MKNIFFIALLLVMVSCKDDAQPPRDYAVIHGKITNVVDSTNFRLFNPITSKSLVIAVDKDGNFRDTLKLENPTSFNAVYDNVFPLYLRNDMDLQIDFNSDKIVETLTFTGKGEEENNFLKYKSKRISGLYGKDYQQYLGLNENDFTTTTTKFMDDFHAELAKKASVLDSSFVTKEKNDIEEFKKSILALRTEQLEINEKLGPGKPSPEFNDYTNYAGGTSSLKDYRGSYVYIDVWATWCVPCIMEIPFLEKVEKEYHDKNIKFVSLSIDNIKDEQKWRKMIKDKNMGGIQILADKDYESQFISDYFIYGIPRFILIDPQGNIVNYDAPRPSEEKLKTLFNSLDI